MGRCLRAQARAGSAGLFIILIIGPRTVISLRLHGLRLLLAAARRELRRSAQRRTAISLLLFDAGFKYGAATAGEPRCIISQAGHDAADIRDPIAAETPDVRRAGHLLLIGSAIFLRRCGGNYAHATDCDSKAEDNPLRSHGRSPYRSIFN